MIKTEKLCKSYPFSNGYRTILRDVDMEIEKGEFSIIAGRSGAGKSTLLHLLAGLDTPDSGRCIIGNTVISDVGEEERARIRLGSIGFVFQTFNFLSSLKIRDNIIIPGILLENEPFKTLEERTISISEVLGIQHTLDQLPSNVSGGELQRACIARAMINQPGVILADEPTGNLDTENREIVVDSFLKIRKQFKVTVLVVTHDEEIGRKADSIYQIMDGKLYRSK